MRIKKGDTLVEVAFAIGIFSLVAITVVAVISASTSAAQAALETTLTREDIDSQAEALRFIHDSYINGIQSAQTTDNKYEKLWQEITGLAYNVGTNDIITYNPTTCSGLYENGWVKGDVTPTQSGHQPFIIDIRRLNDPSPSNIENIVITRRGSTAGPFAAATTYPRILYAGATSEDLYTQTQIGNNTIQRVEGLFIVAVKGTASITTGNASGGTDTNPKAAYYDFYIRSCWMPTNSDRASTISTLVRLYDPDIIH